MTIRPMTKLDQHFIDIGACYPGREWVAENCSTSAECWGKLLATGRADWAVWWFARDRGWGEVEPLVRRWALRAARVYMAAIMDAYALPAIAAKLRSLSDSTAFTEIRGAALAALDARAALAALEQIADLRELCYCPWQEEE